MSGRDGVAQFFWSKLAKKTQPQVCCVPGKVHFQMPQLAVEIIEKKQELLLDRSWQRTLFLLAGSSIESVDSQWLKTYIDLIILLKLYTRLKHTYEP